MGAIGGAFEGDHVIEQSKVSHWSINQVGEKKDRILESVFECVHLICEFKVEELG